QRPTRLCTSIPWFSVPVPAFFLLWTHLHDGTLASWLLSAAAAVALIAAVPFVRAGREGRAFVLTAATIVLATAALFVTLYPDVMPSTLGPAYSLTVHNASSTPYTLKVMTLVAVVFTPIVLLYQGWTYWVFRRRIGVE